MTCRDIDDLVSVPLEPSLRAPEAVEHLLQCADCRSLLSALKEGAKVTGSADSQIRRIQDRIVQDLKPVQPLAPSRVFLLLCAINFICIVAIGTERSGVNGWGALSVEQRIAVFATLAFGALLLGVSMVGQMVPGSKSTLSPPRLIMATLSALFFVIVFNFHYRPEPAFVANGLTCLKNGLAFSILAAFLFWLMMRRGAILSPNLIGAAIGGLSGLAGLSVLEINCSNLNVFHILVWHCGVVLVGAVGGTLLGVAAGGTLVHDQLSAKSPSPD